jgi:hypothetical protein
MSTQANNKSPPLVAPQTGATTFLTIPQGIRDTVYDLCRIFKVKKAYCCYSNRNEYLGFQILYVCRQIYEEVQPRLYGYRESVQNRKRLNLLTIDSLLKSTSMCTRTRCMPQWRRDLLESDMKYFLRER